MTRKYFGTDGIRGEVGVLPITPGFVMHLGYAAGKVFSKLGGGHGRPTVLIGKDTRISGYMLESALEAGFCAAGVDVVLCGPIPTPGIAYLTSALRLTAGVVISASHNPYQDNGIKFFSAAGGKLPDDIENQIEEMMEQPFISASSIDLGKVRRLDDAAGRYIEFCKSTFPNHYDLNGFKLVVDCANGAAYHIAPNVFHELGADVVAIGNHPNGMNINQDVGATAPKACVDKVLETNADYGIALDGDADRLQMVDSQGRLFNGDELLYLVAKDRIESGKEVRGAVGTVMTNIAIEKGFASLGIPFARAAVGDRYVLEKLKQNNWYMGGESSGHLIFLDKHTTGDGIVAALQVLATVKRSNLSINERLKDIELYPQTLINVRYQKQFDWQNSTELQQAKQDVEAKLGQEGRVLIRASGTEPLIRVMVEAKTKSLSDECAVLIAKKIPVESKSS
jgi:phosphoglucosamine mutase